VVVFLLKPPGKVVSHGLMLVLPVLFFFHSPRVLQGPSADRRETLPHHPCLALAARGLEKFREDSSEVWPIGSNALNFRQNFKFSGLNCLRDPHLPWNVRYSKPCSISNALKI